MQIRRRSLTGAAGVMAGMAALLLPALSWGDVNSQITSASRSVHQAQLEVNQVRQQMGRARTRIAALVQAKPQWAAAVKEFHTAQTALEAVRRQALANLRKKPDYQALVTDRQKAQDILAQADDPGVRVTDTQIKNATGVIMQDGLQIRKMQDDALAGQPGYDEAKGRLDAAQTQMDQLDAEITQQTESDPDYQDAAKNLATSEQKLSQARQQLAQAVQADMQRREQEAKAREQQQAQYGQ